jgi:hypothetical protein
VKQALLAFRAVRRVASVPRGGSLQASLLHGVASGRSCRVPTKIRTPAAAEQPPTPRVGPTRLRSHRARSTTPTSTRFDCSALCCTEHPPSAPSWPRQCRPTAHHNRRKHRPLPQRGRLPADLRPGAPPGFLREITPYATPPWGNRQANRDTKLPSAVSYAHRPRALLDAEA